MTSEKLKDAVSYALNQEENLRGFLSDGNIPPDNGSAERHVKPISLFRRNSMFSFSLKGAEAMVTIVSLIETARAMHIPIICAMGCGNRLDPSYVRCMDLYETSNDPLCRIMRHECRRRHIDHLKVVYSIEKPMTPQYDGPNGHSFLKEKEESGRRALPGSSAFVPAAAGLMIAYETVHDLLG